MNLNERSENEMVFSIVTKSTSIHIFFTQQSLKQFSKKENQSDFKGISVLLTILAVSVII